MYRRTASVLSRVLFPAFLLVFTFQGRPVQAAPDCSSNACPANSTCIPTTGGIACPCNMGFKSAGFSCTADKIWAANNFTSIQEAKALRLGLRQEIEYLGYAQGAGTPSQTVLKNLIDSIDRTYANVNADLRAFVKRTAVGASARPPQKPPAPYTSWSGAFQAALTMLEKIYGTN